MVEILAGIIIVGLCIVAVAAVLLCLVWLMMTVCEEISSLISWREPAWWWKGGDPQDEEVEEERADGPSGW